MAEIKSEKLNSRLLLETAVAAVREKQGRDLAVFDVRRFSSVTDYQLVVSALSTPHIKALYNAVRLAVKDSGGLCCHKSGEPDSGWIVADYLDVVMHFFDQDTRRRYALDELWADVPRVEI
ncbi:MAG: ribosome silencing factor [Kiritimatiellia bacterium]|nr:ribosome silencing factor [Lentisphaerota bacterium]